MKPSALILCLAIWFLSVGSAYYFGKKHTPDDLGQQVETSAKAPAKEEKPNQQLGELDEGLSAGEVAMETVDAFLNGEDLELRDALRAIEDLSPEATRSLLVDAFALPISDPNRSRIISELLENLAKTDPLGALELAGEINSIRDSQNARTAILEVWGASDPIAAIAWAQTGLADEPTRVRGAQLEAIYRGYASLNPEAAFQAALLLEDENPRLISNILEEVIETQIENGGLEAAKYAIGILPEGDQKNMLVRELVDEWASFDPASAAEYVTSLGDQATDRIKSTLLSEWAESDPAAAAEWLSQLPEGDEAYARASAEIIEQWARYDLTASAEWLNSLPASSELDRAVITYTFSAAQEDPATAMTWAESVEDDRRRSFIMERVAATWKEQSPETFTAYLDDADLDAEQREALENAESGRGGGGGGGGGGRGGGGGGRPR